MVVSVSEEWRMRALNCKDQEKCGDITHIQTCRAGARTSTRNLSTRDCNGNGCENCVLGSRKYGGRASPHRRKVNKRQRTYVSRYTTRTAHVNENFRQKRSMHTTRQGFLLLQGAKQVHQIHLVSKGQELLATARRRLASFTRIAESMRSQDAAAGGGTLHVQ